jgi:hypothetical protein
MIRSGTSLSRRGLCRLLMVVLALAVHPAYGSLDHRGPVRVLERASLGPETAADPLAADESVLGKARALTVEGLAYLPEERRLAALIARTAAPFESAIVVYDGAGREVERIGLAALDGSPYTMTYLPHTRQFALTVSGKAREQAIVLLSRSGEVVREIDLAPLGVTRVAALAAFDPEHPSGGRFLVFGGLEDRVHATVVVDFDGNRNGDFDAQAALGLVECTDVAAITAGPHAGAFIVLDALERETVVFRLNEQSEPLTAHVSDAAALVLDGSASIIQKVGGGTIQAAAGPVPLATGYLVKNQIGNVGYEDFSALEFTNALVTEIGGTATLSRPGLDVLERDLVVLHLLSELNGGGAPQ